MAEAQAAPMMLPQLTVDSEEEPIATTPEEWSAIQDQLRSVRGIQGTLGAAAPGPSGTGVPSVPLTTTQPMAPGEPSADAPSGGPEGADIFNRFMTGIHQAGSPGNRRAILRGVGGAAGVAAGMPLGPLGMGAGGFIGDFAGSRIANVLDDIYGSDASEPEKNDMATQFMDDVWVSVRDNTIGTAAGRALPTIWFYGRHPRALLSRWMKLPPNSAQLFREAQEMGVDIGAANLTGTGGLGGGLVNVFSRMPFMGTTAKQAANTQAKRLVEAQARLFGRVGEQRGMAEISEEALQAGQNFFAQRANGVMARFEHAARIGFEAGPILNSRALVEESRRVLAVAQQQPGGANSIIPRNMRNALTTIQQYPELIDTNTVMNLKVFLERNQNYNSRMRYPMMERLNEAADRVLATSNHPAARAVGAAEQQLNNLMTDSSDFMYKNFGTMRRTGWGAVRFTEGTRSADEVAKLLEKMNGPEQVARLRTVVGDDTIRDALRLKLDNAWDVATGTKDNFIGKQLSFNSEKFNKVLGLDNRDGRLFATTQEMLRGTGVQADDLRKLAQTAQLVANVPLGDTSTFVMRAAVLKGSAGLGNALKHAFALSSYGAVGAAAGGPGTIAGAIALRTVVNSSLGAMLKPSLLKTLIAAMDPSVHNLQALKNVPGASRELLDAIKIAETTENLVPAQIQALYLLFKDAPEMVFDGNAP